jgi:hypothetical protein
MKIHALFISLVLAPLIASCTPDQINSAIEACKGDPACYEIIDTAIEEELASRGITGGKMTNVELNEATYFLETYLIGIEPHNINNYKLSQIIRKNFLLGSPPENQIILSSIDALVNDFYGSASYRILPNLQIFNLANLNTEDKQLFYSGTSFNRTKHMIYKTGEDVYSYEVYGDEAYIFSLQLELDSLFFRDKRYISPHAMYEYFESYSWDSIFNDGPVSINNDSFNLSINKLNHPNGLLFNEYGYSYYMKDDPIYETYLPFETYFFYPINSQKRYIIYYGFNGSYDDFKGILGISVEDFGLNSLAILEKHASIALEVTEAMRENPLSIESLLSLIESETPYYSSFEGLTKEILIDEITNGFLPYLSMTLSLEKESSPTE